MLATAILAALSSVLQIAIGNLLLPHFQCPPFTLAFNAVLILFVQAANRFSRFGVQWRVT